MLSLIILIMTVVVMCIAGNVFGLSWDWVFLIAVIGSLLSTICDDELWEG